MTQMAASICVRLTQDLQFSVVLSGNLPFNKLADDPRFIFRRDGGGMGSAVKRSSELIQMHVRISIDSGLLLIEEPPTVLADQETDY